MNIVFITTQSAEGSSNIGRVVPLAEQLSRHHDVYVLMHTGNDNTVLNGVNVCITGKDPFIKTPNGKKRLRGMRLIGRMKWNAIRAAWVTLRLAPDVVVVEKALPESVLAGLIVKLLHPRARIMLDTDDYEFAANMVSGMLQRASLHWAERTGARIASAIVAATPFLADHFTFLTQGKRDVRMIPTGVDLAVPVPLYTPDPVFAYIGSVSLSSGHRVDMLPDILQNIRNDIPNARLDIWGSGDDIRKIKLQFGEKGLGNSVAFRGRFNPNDIPKTIEKQKYAALIDPVDGSIANRAKSSYRVALAVSLGVPVVTANIGVRTQLVPQKLRSRILVQSVNAQSYASLCVQWYKEPLTQQQYNTLTSHAGRFTWETLGKQFEKHLGL